METQASNVIKISLTWLSQIRTICFAALLLIANIATAQTGVEIYPIEISHEELSKPSYRIPLYAQLENTRDTKIPVKALITVDGELFTVVPEKAYLNRHDLPEYLFHIQAPLAELSYQFVAYPKDSPAIFSERVSISRECVINTEMPSLDQEAGLSGEAQISALIAQAEILDHEAALYVEAKNISDRLDLLLKEVLKQVSKGGSKDD